MSLLDNVRATAAATIPNAASLTGQAKGRANTLTEGAATFGANLGLNQRGKFLNQIGDLQNQALSRAAGSLDQDTLLGRTATRFAESLGVGLPRRMPQLPPAGNKAIWTPAPHWGGMNARQYYDYFKQSAMTAKSWKNLFYVSVEDLRPSGAGPSPAGGLWNLLATEVSFGVITMPGESTQVGGAYIDKVTGAERVDIRITTMDDAKGTLKRWFEGKAAQVVDADGSVGLPADYLVLIRITHMAPDNLGSDDDRMRHVFLARPSASGDYELSRSESALQMLNLTFVQWDTFMEVR